MSKKIYVSAYSGDYQESSLDYVRELNQFHLMIKAVTLKCSVDADDAYILIRNSLSSVNTYKICESLE